MVFQLPALTVSNLADVSVKCTGLLQGDDVGKFFKAKTLCSQFYLSDDRLTLIVISARL